MSVGEHGLATLRCANFLSSLLQETYSAIASYVGQQLGMEVVFNTGHRLDEFQDGRSDFGFLCGLLYVRAHATPEDPVDLLAAPVLLPERYQRQPRYFSDVVVRRESDAQDFADLGGKSWAYNEEASHSGYNLVQYSLLQRQQTAGYFAKTIRSGSHLQSLELVLQGEADATAIDSHILDVLLLRNPHLASQIRVIDVLGPSTIPPIVAARRLPASLKQRVQQALLNMHEDPRQAALLHLGGIERLVAVQDDDYQDIRTMLARVRSDEQQHAHIAL
ncbi:phosphate/phosphite/phosphonate ABC transporter substrate-binding protein [Dictyobacter halimunensis]